MCNDYGNHVAYAEYAQALERLGMPILAPALAPNLEPRDDIWPTEVAPVIRRREHGVELVQLRWVFRLQTRKNARLSIFARTVGVLLTANDASYRLPTFMSSKARRPPRRNGSSLLRVSRGSALLVFGALPPMTNPNASLC